MTQDYEEKLRKEVELVNRQRGPFTEPESTPRDIGYTNLYGTSQYARINFQAKKRPFKRHISAQEGDVALLKMLRNFWGHDGFRGPQLDICRAVMKGDDVLVVMPTGLGKSVCFQVPAITLEFGLTIVVSPLIALMKDQVAGLKEKGVKVEMLYEKSPDDHLKYIKHQIKMGHPQIRLLYMTPETLLGAKIRYELDKAYEQGQLNRLVVDEAHVIEEWGTTFRSAYRDLSNFRLLFPGIPIAAFTASATAEVRQDILQTLGIRKGEYAQWVEPCNRKNLFYEIRYQGASSSKARIDNLAEFITNYRPEAARRNKDNNVKMETVSGLVYCRSRGACEDVAEELCTRGINTMPFHAHMTDERRTQVLELWKKGLVECIVATIAFGMGVDQAHVRYVIHYDMPKSFEGYYQETGRAGRDGHISRCIMYYSREDALRLRGLMEIDAKRNATKRKTADPSGIHEEAMRKANLRGINSFKFLQHYAEGNRTCRHIAICRYFGETIDGADSEMVKAYCDGMCDVCSNPGMVQMRALAVTEEVRIASQAVRPALEFEDEEYPPTSSPSDQENTPGFQAFGTLHALHGTGLLPHDQADGTVPFRRPAVYSFRDGAGLDHVQRQLERPRLSLEERQGTILPVDAEEDWPADLLEPEGLASNAELPKLVMASAFPHMSSSMGGRKFSKRMSDDVPPAGEVAGKEGLDELVPPSSSHSNPLTNATAALSSPRNSAQAAALTFSSSGGLREGDTVTQPSSADSPPKVQQGLPAFRAAATRYNDDSAQHAGPSRPYLAPHHVDNRHQPESHHASIRTASKARDAAGPNSPSFETPCPRRPIANSRIRTGPVSLLNSYRGITTSDVLEGQDGGHAVPPAMPIDPEKRQRQQEAFKAVKPITGRGPYSYYTNTASPVHGKKRKYSTVVESGVGFKTPFKVPLIPPRQKDRIGMISKEDRTAAIGVIKAALKKSLLDGPEANRLWASWGDRPSRKNAIKTASVDLEAVIVQECATPGTLQKQSEDLAMAIRILRTRQGADLVVGSQWGEFSGDRIAKWLGMVDGVMRGLE